MKNMQINPITQISDVNELVLKDPAGFITEQNNLYDARVAEIAAEIHENRSRYTIVMLSGPSGSGKTTTASVLKRKLETLGASAKIISLDNFYLGEGKAPRLADGSYDYETVHALDLEQLHDCMLALIEDGQCNMPHFDFKTSQPSPHKLPVTLLNGDVAIVEGIHAMNPEITETLPADSLKKLYVSVENGISEGEYEVLSPRDIRLIRRMTRDNIFRNSPPVRTLDMWRGVIHGEEKYLFPHKDTADITLNTFHGYEPCLFKKRITVLLEMVKPDEYGYDTAQHIIKDMAGFKDIDERLIPSDAMLREFIGGSEYHY